MPGHGEQVSLDRLRQLLDQGEGDDLDFKACCDLSDRYAVVAIAKDVDAFSAAGGHRHATAPVAGEARADLHGPRAARAARRDGAPSLAPARRGDHASPSPSRRPTAASGRCCPAVHERIEPVPLGSCAGANRRTTARRRTPRPSPPRLASPDGANRRGGRHLSRHAAPPRNPKRGHSWQLPGRDSHRQATTSLCWIRSTQTTTSNAGRTPRNCVGQNESHAYPPGPG